MRPTKSFVLRAMTMQISKLFGYFHSFLEKFSITKEISRKRNLCHKYHFLGTGTLSIQRDLHCAVYDETMTIVQGLF